MPIAIPRLDDRRYQDLLDEAVARIPIHNPEWTNFNKSDPGITLIEVFAFLTENLLYRSNLIPDRNRKKFLSLLGVGLRTAASAAGLVRFANDRGPLTTLTLNAGLEVRAGEVPFQTEQGLDVLPVEVRPYFKRERANPSPAEVEYYTQLYASFVGDPPTAEPQLYEVVQWHAGLESLDLGDTIDASLWLALLTRTVDDATDELGKTRVRQALGGKTVSLGVVPSLTEAQVEMIPGGPALPPGGSPLRFQVPSIPASGGLPPGRQGRVPQYRDLDGRTANDVLVTPGVVEITLPAADALTLWNNIDPLEAGVGDFPPTLEDTDANDRLVTWLRIKSAGATPARLLWADINSVLVRQRQHVAGEILRDGSGEPDQLVTLSKRPVLPGSVTVTVTSPEGQQSTWNAIDDLFKAGPEVPVQDVSAPGSAPRKTGPVKVFLLDAEAGELRFGDGARGGRPIGEMRVSYDASMGALGNVGPDALNRAAALPAGFTVTNPVRTWGGADAETVGEGEKQITRYLQHRDRLVTALDFETIARRAPGADIGRIEVIAAYNSALAPSEPGDAPGAVTLMVIPRFDPDHPDAPEPDRLFLDALCRHLEPRRLVTTEVFLRGPDYQDVWISAGIDVIAGIDVPTVREAVRAALLAKLSPLPADPEAGLEDDAVALLTTPQHVADKRGWPLGKPVDSLELMAVASRVPGVRLVTEILLAAGTKTAAASVPMTGLQLPRVRGVAVAVGAAMSLDDLRGQTTPAVPAPAFVPVPVILEEC